MNVSSGSDLNILYLDNHLIAVHKPSGMLTQSDESGEDSLMDRVKTWIKTEYEKPGNVFLGLVHRLDRPVSGVVLFARTSKAASRLSEQFRERRTKKVYRAVVQGTPKPESARLIHHIRKEKTLKATVFPRSATDAKQAELSYKIIETFKMASVVEVELVTGRFHQIRAQMAFAGHSVLGDVKYGAEKPLPGQEIALYACKLMFSHPVSKEEINIQAAPPANWPYVDRTSH